MFGCYYWIIKQRHHKYNSESPYVSSTATGIMKLVFSIIAGCSRYTRQHSNDLPALESYHRMAKKKRRKKMKFYLFFVVMSDIEFLPISISQNWGIDIGIPILDTKFPIPISTHLYTYSDGMKLWLI